MIQQLEKETIRDKGCRLSPHANARFDLATAHFFSLGSLDFADALRFPDLPELQTLHPQSVIMRSIPILSKTHLERLIPRPGHDHTPIRTNRTRQNPAIMRPHDLMNLLQPRITPQRPALLRVPMGGDDLFAVVGPNERGDLAFGREGGEARARGGGPEVDGRVVGAAAGGEEGVLPGAPGDGLQSIPRSA